jgi:hypothetical protein
MFPPLKKRLEEYLMTDTHTCIVVLIRVFNTLLTIWRVIVSPLRGVVFFLAADMSDDVSM